MHYVFGIRRLEDTVKHKDECITDHIVKNEGGSS
jgi:hypothetical protein